MESEFIQSVEVKQDENQFFFLEVKGKELFEIQEVCQEMLEHSEMVKKVVEFLDKSDEFSRHLSNKYHGIVYAKRKPINIGVHDWYTWESGIYGWWGVGSVTVMELGLQFSFTLNQDGFELRVK